MSNCCEGDTASWFVGIVMGVAMLVVLNLIGTADRDFDQHMERINKAEQYCSDNGGIDTYEYSGVYHCANGASIEVQLADNQK